MTHCFPWVLHEFYEIQFGHLMRLDSWNLLRCLWRHALTCSDRVSCFPMTWTCRQHCCIVGRCQLRYCTANQNYFSSAKSSKHFLDSSWYHQSECLKIIFSCFKASLSTLSTYTSQKKTLKKILQSQSFKNSGLFFVGRIGGKQSDSASCSSFAAHLKIWEHPPSCIGTRCAFNWANACCIAGGPSMPSVAPWGGCCGWRAQPEKRLRLVTRQ